MKKLFAVLMIAGLFGFASCGSSEPKADEGTAVDSAASAAAPTTEQSAAPADSAAAPASADTTMK